MKKETLWTKSFTYITTASVLSIIGGEVMNLPLSLLVFKKTQSTMLSAVILICGMLPIQPGDENRKVYEAVRE